MVRTTKILMALIITLYISTSCDTVENESSQVESSEWIIPESQVFDGGPGKDGIPALDSPELTNIENIDYLNEDDLVIVFSLGNETRIYPHPILDWHEIINDKIGGTAYAMTYCPLTGSAICWDRILDGEETTFGVSGLLYNSNLIAYDRKTGSNWSQMRIQSVQGSFASDFAKTFPLIETSWRTAKESFPLARVVTTNTGYSRNYSRYPYGNYRTNNGLLVFPVNNNDNRLESKQRVLGLLDDGSTKAYSIADFQGGRLVNEIFNGNKYLIYGDEEKNIITVFKQTNRNSQLNFSISNLELPFIIEDNLGNHYDLMGHSNNENAEDLVPAKSFIAYWFAWAAFYPNTELYSN